MNMQRSTFKGRGLAEARSHTRAYQARLQRQSFRRFWESLRRQGGSCIKCALLPNEPTDLWVENSIYQFAIQWVTREKFVKKRWVRFPKRTHRERFLVGFGCRGNYFAASRRTRFGKRTHREGVWRRVEQGNWVVLV